MKRIILIAMSILLVFSFMPFNNIYGGDNNNDFLDIKIGRDINSSDYLTLSSQDGFYIYDKSYKYKDIFQIANRDIIISSNNYDEIDILDLDNNIIQTIPGDGSIIIGSGSRDDSIIQVDKNSYRDFISFIIKPNKISIINHIDVEKYLYGVVPREVGSSFPIESIKAQAVAARTFAMANKNKHGGEGFDLCETTHCQVYGGVVAEHQTTSRAVDETKGMYVYYNGNFADTTFHSNNGGYIESSKDVWGGHLDYLVAKEDPFSANTTSSTWNLELTSEELNNKVSSAGIQIGKVLDIEILEESQANRILKLKLIGSLDEEVISGTKLRTILGNTSMKSTWFNIIKEGEKSNNSNRDVYVFDLDNSKVVSMKLGGATVVNGDKVKSKIEGRDFKVSGDNKTKEIVRPQTSTPKSFKFEGRGYGHGVGMSQHGAAEMARQGHSYEEILKYYYPGVDIEYKGQ